MATIDVTLVWSNGPRHVQQHALVLQEGATLDDALRAAVSAGWLAALPPAEARVGVWGRVPPRDTLLRAQDRIEIYRPLRVDPKEARRQRAKTARARGKKS